MFAIQCFAEIDRQFKGEVAEPGTDRNKLFLQRTSPTLCIFLDSKLKTFIFLY